MKRGCLDTIAVGKRNECGLAEVRCLTLLDKGMTRSKRMTMFTSSRKTQQRHLEQI